MRYDLLGLHFVSSCARIAEYGVYALAGSILLTMMGVSLMFEKNLIRLGNVSLCYPLYFGSVLCGL